MSFRTTVLFQCGAIDSVMAKWLSRAILTHARRSSFTEKLHPTLFRMSNPQGITSTYVWETSLLGLKFQDYDGDSFIFSRSNDLDYIDPQQYAQYSLSTDIFGINRLDDLLLKENDSNMLLDNASIFQRNGGRGWNNEVFKDHIHYFLYLYYMVINPRGINPADEIVVVVDSSYFAKYYMSMDYRFLNTLWNVILGMKPEGFRVWDTYDLRQRTEDYSILLEEVDKGMIYDTLGTKLKRSDIVSYLNDPTGVLNGLDKARPVVGR